MSTMILLKEGAAHAPGVEDGCLNSGVAANQQYGICLLKAHECGVHDVVAAHICIQVREAPLAVQITAAQPVHQVLHPSPIFKQMAILT